ncbi:aspartate ammonia-lyase [Scatolibacter rhodanostii]|uniref:aspartate ammonia-lyase n=1 Tax=Scatolibacter rhodanostii TaxID=2014781 RepID=UPI000C0820F6|nr:aspartate ammonia-lyase [Scatolibacter rhodanostii]
MHTTRIESDSIGNMSVPKNALYGVQSLRAKHNFSISGQNLHPELLRNLVLIKKAAATSNMVSQDLTQAYGSAIIQACDQLLAGNFKEAFIVDSIQGGAGTSANMNVNEVIANLASEMLGAERGSYLIHPNDHVNMSQSTNDVVPTSGKLTALTLTDTLLHELNRLYEALINKSEEFALVVKMGRTQLQDAVPMRLGQSFHAFASCLHRDIRRIQKAREEMKTINLGATAIGSCINASPIYLESIIPILSQLYGEKLYCADDLFDATQNLDGFVTVSSALKTCAINLSKMCNDLRLLSSGPKTGLGEIQLPKRQNGSSIMPGKVNPVIPEVVNQVAFAVVGNDLTISLAAEGGQLELNAFEPILFCRLFESLDWLTHAVSTLVDNCIVGITANEEHCTTLVESSAGIATALCPYIGYQKSALLAKKSLQTGVSVLALALEEHVLDENILHEILDPVMLSQPLHQTARISS